MGEYKRQMMQCMIESNVNSMEMIQVGLRKMRAHSKPFLPSPGEFCEACKPTSEDMGLPSPEQAYQLARTEVGKAPDMRTWPYAIAKTAKGLEYELKGAQNGTSIERDLRTTFINKYRKIVDGIVATGVMPIDDPARQIEKQKPVKAGEHVANESLSNLKGMFE